MTRVPARISEQPFSTSSAALSALAIAGLMVLAVLPPPQGRSATAKSDPHRTAQSTATTAPQRSALPDQGSPETANSEAIDDTWPEADIVQGREQCSLVLRSVAGDWEFLPPLKDTDCGSPVPVRLKSVGSTVRVRFDPPVIVNCRMVAALSQWSKTTLQPAAKKHLGAPVAEIVASGYSCRNVYWRRDAGRSQHASANAIDIAAFVLKDGRRVSVLDGWGPTARERKAAAKLAAQKTAATTKAGSTQEKPSTTRVGQNLTKASLALPIKRQAGNAAASSHAADAAQESAKEVPTPDVMFLKSLHRGACHDFKTVLGPEANKAHRDHFHFDLTSLRSYSYCE